MVSSKQESVMKLSVACNFAPDFVERVSAFGEVSEIYGKSAQDAVGGGRSSYTLEPAGKKRIEETIRECAARNIDFNYLMNAATLGGIEQTRSGQKKIRRLLDWIAASGASAVTVASPYLLRVVKKQYPCLKVKVGVFAVVDNPVKAREWEDMGADCICLSAISCNRDYSLLRKIRSAVGCELQLIANASCLLHCTHELTHMNLLSQSSRTGDFLKGFCLDYCVLHCSYRKLRQPVDYIRSVWIRPEDLEIYEAMGYDSFKIVERSSPTDLLITRVRAYASRTFGGNLLEIVGPVAQVNRRLTPSLRRRVRMMLMMARPGKIPLISLLKIQRYADGIIPHDYRREATPAYIDNNSLSGFISGLPEDGCSSLRCDECGYCGKWAAKAVSFNEPSRKRLLEQAEILDRQLLEGSLWRN